MIFKPKHITFCIIIFASFLTTVNFNAGCLFSFSKNDLSGTDFVTLKPKVSKVESDSITSTQIVKIWYNKTELNVQVSQVEKQQEVSIMVYNMLGKEVLEVFKGTSSTSQEEIYSKSFNLPNGIYICVLQGKNFKDSEKFIISR